MIIVRSPLRISFAGGGTDLKEYYKNGYGLVCSMAINKYVYVTINNLSTYFPHRFRIAYSQTELVQDVNSIKHPIVREALKLMQLDEGGIDINVMADIPAGTGMGSSSSFTVCLLHALHTFRNQLVAKEKLAEEACHLEVELLKEPIGKQDQYAAAYGGLNLLRFYANERVNVEPVPLSQEIRQQLRERLLLFYLGGNRPASNILKEQNLNTKLNQPELDRMRDQADEVAKILTGKTANLADLGRVLKEGWDLKKNLANGISSSEIDQMIDRGLKAGALGGKLLGAGGTGFLLFYVPEGFTAKVKQALASLTCVGFELDDMGSSLLYFGS